MQGLPHIGHVRSGVAFDVLRRWLMAKGYDVAFIRNVTDIDDKILNKAADAGRPWWEWAATYERAFSAAYDALGVLPPSAEPRATGHITQMVELIERLIERGHAYTGGGDVYFDVLSLPDYGKLSGHKIDDVHQGEGVATGKRDERDFTLWKGAKPGEPSWPTPWGRGRPGWHTECVAMCEAYLGAEFDIHAGGMDLVFPHHENEIAQAEAAGDPFARFWLHNGWVTMGGEKMSKSLGNVLAIPAVLQRVRPAELRYYLGSAHYRSMLEFSENALQDAAKAYTGIEDFLHRVRNRVGAVVPGEWTPKFAAALDDDLSVPIALAEVHAARAEGNRALDAGDHETALAHAMSIRAMMGILGADPLDERWESHDETSAALAAVDVLVHAEVQRREDARARRDWAEADAIRDRLKEAGIEVTDTADGPQWSLLGRVHEVNGWKLAAPGCGSQTRDQEGADGRVRRCAPARARGPRRDAARTYAAQPPRRQARGQGGQQQRRPARKTDDTEIVLGRNPVLECLRAGVPATALYVALGTEADERLTESVRLGGRFRHLDPRGAAPRSGSHRRQRAASGHRAAGAAVLTTPIPMTCWPMRPATAPRAAGGTGQHLRSPQPRRDRPIGRRVRGPRRADPAAAVGVGYRGGVAHQRRCGRPGAGGRATNLNRTLKNWADAGLQVVGLDADGDTTVDELDGVGSDGRGGRFRGQGTVAAGAGELRCRGVHPDGRADGVVERLGGRRCGAGRNRPPAT